MWTPTRMRQTNLSRIEQSQVPSCQTMGPPEPPRHWLSRPETCRLNHRLRGQGWSDISVSLMVKINHRIENKISSSKMPKVSWNHSWSCWTICRSESSLRMSQVWVLVASALSPSNLPMFFGHKFSIDHPQMGMGLHHKPYQKYWVIYGYYMVNYG
jgi:hypothetical protein